MFSYNKNKKSYHYHKYKNLESQDGFYRYPEQYDINIIDHDPRRIEYGKYYHDEMQMIALNMVIIVGISLMICCTAIIFGFLFSFILTKYWKNKEKNENNEENDEEIYFDSIV